MLGLGRMSEHVRNARCFDTAVVLLNGACLDMDLVGFRRECERCRAFADELEIGTCDEHWLRIVVPESESLQSMCKVLEPASLCHDRNYPWTSVVDALRIECC